MEAEEGALKMGLRGGESLSGGAKMRSWFVGFAIGGLREKWKRMVRRRRRRRNV